MKFSIKDFFSKCDQISSFLCSFQFFVQCLLHCSNYSEELLSLLNTIKNIDMYILQQNDSKFTIVLLFGDTFFDINKNTFILDVTIDYIISAGRFDEPLFNSSLLAFVSITLETIYIHILY